MYQHYESLARSHRDSFKKNEATEVAEYLKPYLAIIGCKMLECINGASDYYQWLARMSFLSMIYEDDKLLLQF